MLIFVFTTWEAPSMRDVPLCIKRATRELGNPDRVFVVDPSGDAVFELLGAGVAVQVAERAVDIPEVREADYALILTGDDTHDMTVWSWFESRTPPDGRRWRLVEFSSWLSLGHMIVAEKPTPPIEEFIPGKRIPALGS